MGLEFVNPALLLGISAAAVPIVLHLIMRQQPRLLEFPALRFVRQKQEANRRRLKLRQRRRPPDPRHPCAGICTGPRPPASDEHDAWL